MEEGGLCVLCCYSFLPPGKSAPTDDNGSGSTLSTFATQVINNPQGNDGGNIVAGELRGLSACPECLSMMTLAVGKREAVDEVEVQVRHLQREILRLLRSLEGLVGEYLEEMRGIRNKIEGGDEACLISQKKMKEGDGVWALRSGVIRVVEELSRFHQRGRQFTALSPNHKVEEMTVKIESNEEEEDLFPNMDQDELLRIADSLSPEESEESQSVDDLVRFTGSLSGQVGKAVAAAVPEQVNIPPTTSKLRARKSKLPPPEALKKKKSLKNKKFEILDEDDLRMSSQKATKLRLSLDTNKQKKKRKSQKPETTTSIPPSSRVYPDSHLPPWATLKEFLNRKRKQRRKQFACLSCPGVEFRHHHSLEQHLREHEQSSLQDPRPCPHCPLTFHHPQYWEYHVCCHEGIFRTVCDTCLGRKVYNFFSLESHLQKDHQIEKVLQCPNCLFCCAKPDTYISHLENWHANGKGIQACYLCPVTFTTPPELCQHLHQEHNALQPLKCDQEGCDKEFFTEEALKSHQNLHLDRFACPECHRKLRSLGELKRHQEVFHQGRRWHCRHCAKELTSAFSLKSHEKLCGDSEKVVKWQCHLCEKAFRQEGGFKAHLRWHAGETWKCDQCDATFIYKSDLKKHQRVKHPDPFDPPVVEEPSRRFPCEICGATLSSQNKLNRHLRIHEDDRKWACEVCGKTFREKYHLSCHQMTHSTEKQFACPDCGKAYNQPAGLYQHRRSAHGSVPAKETKK